MNLKAFDQWNTNQKIIAGGFVLAVISLFLPWASISFMGMEVSGKGINSFETIFPVLLLIYPLLTAITDIKNIHKYSGVGLAVLAFIITILNFSGAIEGAENAKLLGIEISIGIGVYLFFLGTIAVGLGHLLELRKPNESNTNNTLGM